MEPGPTSITHIPWRLQSLLGDMTEGGTCVFLASAALHYELEMRGVDTQRLEYTSPCCAHQRGQLSSLLKCSVWKELPFPLLSWGSAAGCADRLGRWRTV